uniref:Small G protein signaling modulator 1 n=1 Tax=Denticeps clupeoides TaxID=299321 RepID=A0AAY4BIH6_9TELE
LLFFFTEAETRQRLLRNVKKEVKQIMEEAVTRKFVHEDSSHIISFCGVIEACVLHGLKRRAAGFLRSNKLAALFVKVGKTFPPAETLCSKVQELEQEIESKQNQARLNQDSSQKPTKIANLTPQAIRHMWVRTALTEKVLDKIVLYLVENSSKFYEKEALLRDPVDGPILASLLVGPCALDYTKAKTANHFWTDPSADELVQRHRIHSGYCRQDSPTKRPALIRKRQSSGSMDDRPMFWARDYVESLHQNSRATLLFGKNNVLVQPTDDMEAIPGYLSLHQSADLMTLKWTPNQLMNGNMGDVEYEKSMYWDYAMTIRLEEIVYLHCHQQVDSGGTVVLVSQDGIQRPPLRFPKGGHLLQFLTCLENGLLPHGQLDPPLWSQRGKGKVFPRLRRRSPHGSCESVSDKDEDEATDYVFRILLPGSQSEFGMTWNCPATPHHYPHAVCMILVLFTLPTSIPPSQNLLFHSFILSVWQPTPPRSSCSSCAQNGSADIGNPNGCNHDRAPLKLLCETMKYQIISRAFYGWLAYCRHLSTVRTHLSALVNPTIVECDFPVDASGGLSKDVWETFLQDSTAYDEQELLRLVYFGGVDSTIRKEVWPFILGHYHFTMTEKERKEVSSSSERRSRVCSHSDSNSSTQVFGSVDEVDEPESEAKPKDEKPPPKVPNGSLPNGTTSPDSGHPSSRNFSTTSALSDCSPSDVTSDVAGAIGATSKVPEMETDLPQRDEYEKDHTKSPDLKETPEEAQDKVEEIETLHKSEVEIESTPKVDQLRLDVGMSTSPEGTDSILSEDEPEMESLFPKADSLAVGGDLKNEVASPVSSIGTTYSQDLLDKYMLNLHRIEKDVHRCDRNYWYFTSANLEKLRNIMCSYVWQHLDIGYVQGMCDLLAPLLVILDDEAMAFSCFTELMKRMNQNFPHGGAMDSHFANMRSLIQILDSELFELMQQNGDYTHFYFCYRWFLLDFKREMVYDDVFSVWETIWAAKYASSSHFVLFIALALVEIYRDIILENNMDFTEIIKFFNEMAERHDVKRVLVMARDLVNKVQTLIENK